MYSTKANRRSSARGRTAAHVRYKDTATAFNGEKKEELAGKGRLNAAISNLLYGYLAQNGVKTHLLEVVEETTVLVKKAEIVRVFMGLLWLPHLRL